MRCPPARDAVTPGAGPGTPGQAVHQPGLRTSPARARAALSEPRTTSLPAPSLLPPVGSEPPSVLEPDRLPLVQGSMGAVAEQDGVGERGAPGPRPGLPWCGCISAPGVRADRGQPAPWHVPPVCVGGPGARGLRASGRCARSRCPGAAGPAPAGRPPGPPRPAGGPRAGRRRTGRPPARTRPRAGTSRGRVRRRSLRTRVLHVCSGAVRSVGADGPGSPDPGFVYLWTGSAGCRGAVVAGLCRAPPWWPRALGDVRCRAVPGTFSAASCARWRPPRSRDAPVLSHLYGRLGRSSIGGAA